MCETEKEIDLQEMVGNIVGELKEINAWARQDAEKVWPLNTDFLLPVVEMKNDEFLKKYSTVLRLAFDMDQDLFTHFSRRYQKLASSSVIKDDFGKLNWWQLAGNDFDTMASLCMYLFVDFDQLKNVSELERHDYQEFRRHILDKYVTDSHYCQRVSTILFSPKIEFDFENIVESWFEKNNNV